MKKRKSGSTWTGFTLAELLISLAILGVIATFSIPKILIAQQNAQNNARAKDVAGMLSGAFNQIKLNGQVTTNTRGIDLTPYLNYLSYDTTSGRQIDNTPGFSTTYTCSSTYPCADLPGGGVLLFLNNCSLGGLSNLNYLEFLYDPDGTVNGDYVVNAWSWQGKSVQFLVYADGFTTSRDNMKSGSIKGGCAGSGGPASGMDPGWFTW